MDDSSKDVCLQYGNILMRLIDEGLVYVDAQSFMKQCYAPDSPSTDPGRSIGIRLRGVENSAKEWPRYLHCAGENAAMTTNTVLDCLTNIGSARLHHKIVRRYCRQRIQMVL